jgi:hypothetical protein
MPHSRRASFGAILLAALVADACSHGRIGIVTAEYAAPACARDLTLPKELHERRWDAVLRPADRGVTGDCPGVAVYELREPDPMQGPVTRGFVFVRRPEPAACRWEFSTVFVNEGCGDAPEQRCKARVDEARDRLADFAAHFAPAIGRRTLGRQGDFVVLPKRDPVNRWCRPVPAVAAPAAK